MQKIDSTLTKLKYALRLDGHFRDLVTNWKCRLLLNSVVQLFQKGFRKIEQDEIERTVR